MKSAISPFTLALSISLVSVAARAQTPPPAPPPGGGTIVQPSSSVYTLSGGSDEQNGQSFVASSTDQSGVWVTNGGTLSLQNSTVGTSGNSSSPDSSSFVGLNAAVLANGGGTIDMLDDQVSTTGIGANGVFASGAGSSISLRNTTIDCKAQLAHGVDATDGASLSLQNVTITTSGANAAAVATDRGGGTITVEGGTMSTSGADAPGIYSTGTIAATGASFSASGSEGAVIEGANSIDLTDSSLSGEKKRGVMIYQSMSGDAEGTLGKFTMTRGSLSASEGPAFYVTNSTGIITLQGVTITAASGVLLNAAAGDWGTSGANGGTAKLSAQGQALSGDVVVDQISSAELTLANQSSLTGAINPDRQAKSVSLALDGSSTWTVTKDSTLSSLSDGAGISGNSITNIVGNGFTVHYDKSLPANSRLGGRTYDLVNGGTLTPSAP